MLAPLKNSVKKSPTSGAAKSAFGSVAGTKTQGVTSSALFVERYKVLKAYGTLVTQNYIVSPRRLSSNTSEWSRTREIWWQSQSWEMP